MTFACFLKSWTWVETEYDSEMGDAFVNRYTWNRLGFCNQNPVFIPTGIGDYNKILQIRTLRSKTCHIQVTWGLFTRQSTGETVIDSGSSSHCVLKPYFTDLGF
jgi:hypothetical protein